MLLATSKIRTFSRKEKHQKCIDLLELIEYAERRIAVQEENLKTYTIMDMPFSRKNEIVKKINDHHEAIERITSRYYDILMNIKLY